MTTEQIAILNRLRRVTFQPASPDKRFVRGLTDDQELTPRQAAYLIRLDHRYRRQTGHVCGVECEGQ